MRSREMGWTGQIAYTRNVGNSCTILVKNPKGRGHLGDLGVACSIKCRFYPAVQFLFDTENI